MKSAGLRAVTFRADSISRLAARNAQPAGPHGVRNFVVPFFCDLSPPRDRLSREPKREPECQRVIKILANENLGVDALKVMSV